MKEGTVLKERYTLLRRIGRGGTAVTWLAEDRATGGKVVVKLLSLSLLEEWKAVELFEREAGALKGMHHEGIPRYVEYFRSGTGERTRFALVQEHVEGRTLQEMVDAGWRGTEEEICGIGIRLLRIVEYIHSLRPAMIHRDINPRNVIVREDGPGRPDEHDGKGSAPPGVFLVDFGGVQDAVRISSAASATVIGTPGFMPMEQFVGRATVRSDLYACAATLLFLLTHRNPQDLPVKDMKIDVASAVDLSPGLARVLDSWLEPDEARRTLSIEEAIACLERRPAEHGGKGGAPTADRLPARREGTARRGEAGATRRERAMDMLTAFQTAMARGASGDAEDETGEGGEGDADLTPPRFSRIRVDSDDDGVQLAIPSRSARGKNNPLSAAFSFIWLAFVTLWTSATVLMGAWPMAFFSIPFWLVGIGLMGGMLKGALGTTILRLDARKGFTFERRFPRRRSVTVPFSQVGRMHTVETGTVNHQPVTALELEVGARTFTFGQNLSTVERRWVQRNVNALARTMGAGKG